VSESNRWKLLCIDVLKHKSDVSVWDDSIDYEGGLAALYIPRIMASYLYPQQVMMIGGPDTKHAN